MFSLELPFNQATITYSLLPQVKNSHRYPFSRYFLVELDTLKKFFSFVVKDALSGLRQFLATESPLKMMKNAFYFTLKALFILKMFKFLSWLFGHV